MQAIRRSPTAVFAALWFTAATAAAVDLAKIDRSIAKEPAYQGKPRYCLLVFGHHAKSRLWLVQDGNVLYVDRNGNGDVTDDGDRVVHGGDDKATDFLSFQAGDIKDGPLTHTKLSVTRSLATEAYVGDAKEWARIKTANPKPYIWSVGVTAERAAEPDDGLPKTVRYIVNGDGLGFLVFGDRPADAPVIHFNGPWSLGLQDMKQRIVIGKPRMLQIGVGTQGIGPGTFSFVLYPGLIPDTAWPVADITFPPKSPGPRVEAKVVLKQRC
jgi:hypothetical protein